LTLATTIAEEYQMAMVVRVIGIVIPIIIVAEI